jgi:YHS domain-containing protein
MAKDVVCGMDVDERDAIAKAEYKGEKYFFCSVFCKAAFMKEPERFLPNRRSKGKEG